MGRAGGVRTFLLLALVLVLHRPTWDDSRLLLTPSILLSCSILCCGTYITVVIFHVNVFTTPRSHAERQEKREERASRDRSFPIVVCSPYVFYSHLISSITLVIFITQQARPSAWNEEEINQEMRILLTSIVVVGLALHSQAFIPHVQLHQISCSPKVGPHQYVYVCQPSHRLSLHSLENLQ